MTRNELESIVTGFMDSFTTLTLACSFEDKPWAAAVYYARQGLDLVFFSSPLSRHSKVFAENDRAAGTIHGDYTGWKEIKGLQMEGRVESVSGTVRRAGALAAYLKRYPFVSEFFSGPLSTKIAKVQLYVFRPEVIHYVNNEEGFGKRWKVDVKDGRAVGTPTRT